MVCYLLSEPHVGSALQSCPTPQGREKVIKLSSEGILTKSSWAMKKILVV